MHAPDWLTQTREYYAALYLDAVFAYPDSAKPVPLWLCVTIQQKVVAEAVNQLVSGGQSPDIAAVIPLLGSDPQLCLDYWPIEHAKTPPRALVSLQGPLDRLHQTVAVFKALDGLEGDGRVLRTADLKRKLQVALDALK